MIREVSPNSSTTSRANCSYYSPMQVSRLEFNCRSTAIDKPVNGQPQACLQLSPVLATGNENQLPSELPRRRAGPFSKWQATISMRENPISWHFQWSDMPRVRRNGVRTQVYYILLHLVTYGIYASTYLGERHLRNQALEACDSTRTDKMANACAHRSPSQKYS